MRGTRYDVTRTDCEAEGLVETLIRKVPRELDGTEVSDQAVMDN